MSYAGKPYQPPGSFAPPQEATNPLGVVALVLGILSVFMGCPLAIGALITGWMGMKKEPSGMARAGFTIGLIMTIFHVVVGVAVLMFFVFIVGIAAIAESQDRATANSSSYSESSGFDSSYGSPDIAPFPVSMPEPMEMPKMPDPYVPPPMPVIDPATFPRSPDFGMPPNFAPPSGMGPGPGFPRGAFPPGAFPPARSRPG